MDMDLYRKIVDELESWEGPKLKLFRLQGCGEPFMHPMFIEMIKIAKKADFSERVDFFTNGSIMSDEICNSLIESCVDIIRLSIYSMNEEKLRRVTQTDCKPITVYNNIKKLRELRDKHNTHKPFLLVKMFDSTEEENELFFKTYEGIADKLELETVNNMTNQSGEDFIKAYYNDEKVAERMRREFKCKLNNHAVCSKPFYMFFINSCGGVSPCCDDWQKIALLGDTNRNTLREIWSSRALFNFRKLHLERKRSEIDMCSKCSWYKLFPQEDNIDGMIPEQFVPEGGYLL